MKKSTNCDLQSCSFCKGCLPEWLPAINAHRQTYEIKKGDIIFKEGEEVKGIYFMLSGKVKVHKKWGEEKELIIRFIKAGDIFGHRALGERFYPVSATALQNGFTCCIEIDFFLATLKVNHDYAYNLLMFLAEELQESERKMHNLAQMPVKSRIAYNFIRLINKFGLDDEGVLQIDVTRQDLASYAGTTYETAFRTMSEFIDAGIVTFNGKKIYINDVDALKAEIN